MHPMQHRTLPTAPTPHSFYSEAGSLGRMPAHSTSTVNHDYSEPGDHEIILQQKAQRAGMPMSSSGLSHHHPPPQQPPQPPPPLLSHQQQQQYPFYNQVGGMADMVGPNHGPQHHSYPHSSGSSAPGYPSNKSVSSVANPSGNSRHYESSWAGPYDQPHAGGVIDGPPNSGTLGRSSATNSHHTHVGQPPSYVPTSSTSSSSSYSPTKPSDFPAGANGPTPSTMHPQAMMSAGHHMRFVPPAHPHRRQAGREGADGPGGGKHHRRRKKRPHGREHHSGMPGGHRETGMKDQATNTDLSSNGKMVTQTFLGVSVVPHRECWYQH